MDLHWDTHSDFPQGRCDHFYRELQFHKGIWEIEMLILKAGARPRNHWQWGKEWAGRGMRKILIYSASRDWNSWALTMVPDPYGPWGASGYDCHRQPLKIRVNEDPAHNPCKQAEALDLGSPISTNLGRFPNVPEPQFPIYKIGEIQSNLEGIPFNKKRTIIHKKLSASVCQVPCILISLSHIRRCSYDPIV